MIIYNITFLVENRDEDRFLAWLRNEGIALLTPSENMGDASGLAGAMRLTKVVEVPGDPEFAEQSCSFAMQVDFPDMQSAKMWERNTLPEALNRYTAIFGPEHALSFSTIMRKIKLS